MIIIISQLKGKVNKIYECSNNNYLAAKERIISLTFYVENIV